MERQWVIGLASLNQEIVLRKWPLNPYVFGRRGGALPSFEPRSNLRVDNDLRKTFLPTSCAPPEAKLGDCRPGTSEASPLTTS